VADVVLSAVKSKGSVEFVVSNIKAIFNTYKIIFNYYRKTKE
jgi:hypothetical protein